MSLDYNYESLKNVILKSIDNQSVILFKVPFGNKICHTENLVGLAPENQAVKLGLFLRSDNGFKSGLTVLVLYFHCATALVREEAVVKLFPESFTEAWSKVSVVRVPSLISEHRGVVSARFGLFGWAGLLRLSRI